MTDKEIIIDGVNVAECAYYFPGIPALNTDLCCFHHCNVTWSGKCNSVSNCYYKQLQRKSAECERLKQALDDIAVNYNRMLDIINKTKQKGEDKENE